MKKEKADTKMEAENSEAKQVLELTNDLQRTRADFENYRKHLILKAFFFSFRREADEFTHQLFRKKKKYVGKHKLPSPNLITY